MHIRKLLPLVVALCLSGGGLRAQKILVGADFATRFDNREYANNDFNQSQTLFSARRTCRCAGRREMRPVWASNGRRRTASYSAWTCYRTSASTTARANRF